MADDRLQRFKTMIEADPDNELGHFSLGKAYLENRQYAEAVPCFQRVIELDPDNSKAYHFLALVQIEAGQTEEARAILEKGFDVAHRRGDIKPRDGMASLMRKIGMTPPQVEQVAVAVREPQSGEGTIICRRCQKNSAPMSEPPFKGDLGRVVHQSVCPRCWEEWIPMGTKVINELRLDFSNPAHGDVYDQYMKEFLNIEGM